MSSPSSSLSSFRDYYQHTSEECSEIANQGEFINQGLRNFMISKVFRRLECKIQRVRKWDIFYAFRNIKRERQRNQKKMKGRILLWSILQKKKQRESVNGLKVQYLQGLLNNSHEGRWKELDKLMKFGLRFMKKNYQRASICFNILQHRLSKRKDEVVKKKKRQTIEEKDKILFKLSKAFLCIIARNIVNGKLLKHFCHIKIHDLHKKYQGRGQITFFKPKKDKIFEHIREDRQTIKLSKAAKIFGILTKKCSKIIHYSLKKIQENYSSSANQPKQSLTDSPNIMIGVIQHMIYMTGKATQANKQQNPSSNEMKKLKLQQLLRNDRKKKQKAIRQSLLSWRRIVNLDRIILRRQILELQSIKKHYIEQY